MGCCFRFLVFSSDMGFIAHRLYAYKRIFQVSRELEKRMRKFFLDKFTSYSLFCPIGLCLIYLLCLGISFWLHLCGFELILIVLISVFACALHVWFFFFLISFVIYCRNLISFSLHFSIGCYFPFLVFSSDLGFFAQHL